MRSELSIGRLLWVAGVTCLGLAAGACDPNAAKEDPTEIAQGDTDVAPDEASVASPRFVDHYGEVDSAVYPRFDMESYEFGAFPFPTNRRLIDGRLDLAGFPNPNGVELLDTYLDVAQTELDGFSPSQVVWFGFDGELKGEVPSPLDSVGGDSPVWLIDATPGSDEWGQRLPVEVAFFPQSLSIYIPDNMLAVRPVPGVVLREGGDYVVVVRRAFQDVEGTPIGSAGIVRQYLVDYNSDQAADAPRVWQAALGPARALVDGGLLNPYEVAVAASFTVGHPTAELARVRTAVRSLPTPEPKTWTKLPDSGKSYRLFEAFYEAPAFQSGEKPYGSVGGAFQFGPDGAAAPVGSESIRVALALPDAVPPEGGWPVVLYGHGTGGDYLTFTRSGPQNPAKRLTDVNVAVMSIDQPLHGARWDGTGDLELLSFNFTNPDAGRTNFRQSAVDFMVLLRLVEGGVHVPADIAPGGVVHTLNPARVAYFGHSHGGLGGAMLAAVEPLIRSYVFSGAGGGLTQTLLLRKDPYDFLELIALFIGEPNSKGLTAFHPVLSLVQMCVDVTDPVNYAPHWQNGDQRGGSAVDVLLTEGLLDEATPSITSETLAAAGGLPPAAPSASISAGMQWFGLLDAPRPIAGNWTSASGAPATGGLWQNAEFGHFLVFDNKEAADVLITFLHSALHTFAKIP